MLHHPGLGRGDGVLALLLGRDRIGAQVLLDDAEHFLFQRGIVGDLVIARFFRGLLGELDNGVDGTAGNAGDRT